MIPERNVSVRRAASRQHGGVTGFEQRLHLRLLVRSGVDMPVCIDEPGHRRHAFRIDYLSAGRGRLAGRHGNDFSRTYNDRSALYYVTVTDNDTCIGDSEVLRCKRPNEYESKYSTGEWFHADSSSRR